MLAVIRESFIRGCGMSRNEAFGGHSTHRSSTRCGTPVYLDVVVLIGMKYKDIINGKTNDILFSNSAKWRESIFIFNSYTYFISF